MHMEEMRVERTDRPIGELIAQISRGEILLPEIQRNFVWKPTQVAKLMDSIYRGYPFGSLLFWQTDDQPETRVMAVTGLDGKPIQPPLFLLDGQQRLTSLHRVFHDHDEAQIVFHVETQRFQNQSAATSKDPKWVKVYEVLDPGTKLFKLTQRLIDAGSSLDDDSIHQRLSKIRQLRDRHFTMEVLKGFPYDEVAEIFVRVNSGGRRLGTLDLAMATLSTRWSGVLEELQKEADHWRAQGWGNIDVNFLSRTLAGVVLGRGLSAWSHSSLRRAQVAELVQGWSVVQSGLRRLIQLLRANLKLTRSDPLPSLVVLIPLVVLLGELDEDPTDKATIDGILYWFLLATIGTRYSSGADTKLSQDIRAVRQPDPVNALLANLEVEHARAEVTARALIGRTKESPYFFLSLLAAQARGARDWWYGTEILPALSEQKLGSGHVHPPSTLSERFDKGDINELANLVFISGKAVKRIGGRSPEDYFTELTGAELAAQCVPLDGALRTADAYPRFLAARRESLADAMNALLNRFRPRWLDQGEPSEMDRTAGLSLDLALYESTWDSGRIVFTARGNGIAWTGSASMADLEQAIESARISGLNSDVQIAGESVPVEMIEDSLVVPIGPFLVTGTPEEWKAVLDRERQSARPLSAAPDTTSAPWTRERIPFPITSTD